MPEPAPRIPLKGSFASKEKIVDGIERDRLATQLEQGTQDAEKAKQEEAEVARVKAIDALLPKEVQCVLGKLPYEDFKTWYKSVWDQVERKDHLSRGFCTFTTDVAPGLTVTVRTFKSGELRSLRRLSPSTDPGREFLKYMDEEAFFRAIRVIFGVVSFGGRDLEPCPLPGEDLSKWRGMEEVKSRIGWVDGLSEEIVDLVAGVITDVTMAYRYALQENLKNRFAPL